MQISTHTHTPNYGQVHTTSGDELPVAKLQPVALLSEADLLSMLTKETEVCFALASHSIWSLSVIGGCLA